MASADPGTGSSNPWLGRSIMILVVTLSGALAFGLVLWRKQNQADASGSPVGRARADILFLQSQLRTYLRTTGRFPTEQEGLGALVKANLVRSVPTDPWGRPYVYRLVRESGRVVSFGRDGKEGGSGEDADIDSSFRTPPPSVETKP